MSENYCFKTPFANQPVKMAKTLLKSSRQHFQPNVPLISNKLSSVSCLLVRSEILGPLFNTLTAAEMHSCHNWQKLLQQVQTRLSSKASTFLQVLLHFRNLYKVSSILKKRSPLQLQYVRSYCFRKMWFFEYLKTPVLEHPLEINVLRGPKHC